MSGSDLAPFVAAVLKDSTMHEMINEIDVLQSKLTDRDNKRLLVEVTGQHGSPIYYEESLKNIKQFGDDEIVLGFDNDGSSDGFPFSSLDKIEIRLGGVVVQRFNIDDLDIHFEDDLYDEENQMETILLDINRRHLYGPIVCVDARIKPLPLGLRQGHTGDEMLLTDFFELVADENNELAPQTFIIKALFFDEKDIAGVPDLPV
ncbi:hypothetical protein FRACYDRAFT_251201 [Fragilariopsis cylindrus CCMP1102]|uniref:Uncharacterized protein n=1 Tax=Fragilariopsis cylindrus CCMP1102 TaxID=635003 RepID=A0A1E7ENK1_9STRA|nr:hypothetical protein FRACYDRAFT_251201 [Fragilariopsis cylindrus CCMP1102]|eukprot:OEU07396.1 hypothetical protein FRACYDRAFT_251201 [Fragilariopsis cylindrus CCMP1102]